ncbi:MAG: cytidylate kinase-like family protein [Candidatus Omnitrophica bacterium]|nr:cytidylate kinase-like family protein [Candidatus Omnitrophota bacterium]
MTQTTLQAYKSFMECHMRHDGQGNAETERPFVTISRQTGAGGVTIGKAVVEYLRQHDAKARCPWTLFDKNIVQCVIEQHHLSKEVAQFMPEKKISEVNDIIETLFNLHPPAFALVRQTSETMLRLAQVGHVVIVGRGANVVTAGLKDGLHVRLIGSLGVRVKHTAEYYQLTANEAAEKIKKDDQGRRDYLKQNFAKNVDDPYLYDLVINTDHISYEGAAKMIGDAVLGLKNKSS